MTSKTPATARTLHGSEREAFFERLDRLRVEAGYRTMREFCEASGIDAGIMSRLKNSRRGSLSTPNLIRAAATLGVTPSFLLGTEERAEDGDAPAGSILDIAIGQLVQQHPERATQIVTVATGLAFEGLEGAALDRVKQSIWQAVLEEAGVPTTRSRPATDVAKVGKAASRKAKP